MTRRVVSRIPILTIEYDQNIAIESSKVILLLRISRKQHNIPSNILSAHSKSRIVWRLIDKI
jgi:hypothetical protein